MKKFKKEVFHIKKPQNKNTNESSYFLQYSAGDVFIILLKLFFFFFIIVCLFNGNLLFFMFTLYNEIKLIGIKPFGKAVNLCEDVLTRLSSSLVFLLSRRPSRVYPLASTVR